MKLKLLIVTVFVLFLSSCSDDKKYERLTKSDIPTMTGKKALELLLESNDNDTIQISRISRCPVSSLDRVLKGKTFFTDRGLKIVRGIINDTFIDKKATLDEIDPGKQSWPFKITKAIYADTNFRFYCVVLGIIICAAISSYISVQVSGIILCLIPIYYILAWILKFAMWSHLSDIDPSLLGSSFDGLWEIKRKM